MADTFTQLETNRAQICLLSELIPSSHISIRYTEAWRKDQERVLEYMLSRREGAYKKLRI